MPVLLGDIVECEAEVVYATKHTVHVQTSVKIHRKKNRNDKLGGGASVGGAGGWGGKGPTIVLEDSHSGTFVCLCIHDGDGREGKRPIGRQLLVGARDDDARDDAAAVPQTQKRKNTKEEDEEGEEEKEEEQEWGEERKCLLKYMRAKRAHEVFLRMRAGFHDEP